jgi:hypothetical protein
MSVESSLAFLRIAYDSPELKQRLKAVTGIREIVRLGLRYGYTFDVSEFMEASSSFSGPGPAAAPPPPPDPQTGFLHHEYLLDELPGLKGVIDELPHLKIKPPSVDLERFARTFHEEDLRSTSRSPADPGFRDWHETMMKAHWRDPSDGPGEPRRDFHLVNLDDHVDHPDYDRYFEAKHRTVRTLEAFFDSEVRFSGSLWYPPSSYRLWHTNETQPGWRMYIVDFDEPFADPVDTSFFRYLDPRTNEMVTLRERPRIVRFFRAEQDPARLFWHCIVNPTVRHRWSFGFVVPDDWMDHLPREA